MLYTFKVNNKDFIVNFIVNFGHISSLVVVFLLLTLNMLLPAGSFHVNYVFLNTLKISGSLGFSDVFRE